MPSARNQENARLLTWIRQIRAESNDVSGSPLSWGELRDVGGDRDATEWPV